MRRVVVMLVLSACGFQHGAAPAGGSGGPPDAARDAAADAPDDALVVVPPDACSDADHDGVCDAVDDWPCGAKPAAPATTVTLTGNGTMTSMALTVMGMAAAGQQASQMLVVAPSTALTFTMHYAITDTACPSSCVDQIEVGFIAGNRLGCVYDHGVPNPGGASGNITPYSLTAPATGGTYSFRAHIGQNFSCTYNGANNWWGNTPPGDAATMVTVCVH